MNDNSESVAVNSQQVDGGERRNSDSLAQQVAQFGHSSSSTYIQLITGGGGGSPIRQTSNVRSYRGARQAGGPLTLPAPVGSIARQPISYQNQNQRNNHQKLGATLSIHSLQNSRNNSVFSAFGGKLLQFR